MRGQLVIENVEKGEFVDHSHQDRFNELIVALVDMGYDRNKAEKEIYKLYELNKEKLDKLSTHDVESYLFRLAIANLS